MAATTSRNTSLRAHPSIYPPVYDLPAGPNPHLPTFNTREEMCGARSEAAQTRVAEPCARAPTWHVLPPLSARTLLLALLLRPSFSLLANVPVPIWLINRPTAPRPLPLVHTSLTAACQSRACRGGRRLGKERKSGGSDGFAGLHPRRRGGACAPVSPRRRQLPRGPVQRQRRRRRRRELHSQRRRQVLGPLAAGQGHLVRPAKRRRPRRQRWCLRFQAHQPVPVHVHGLLRQPASVQGRQGLRILLQDSVQKGPRLLRADGDGDHHRHELLPGVQVPLRPQRHRVRPPRQAGPQRQAPPLRHHRHRVHQGAVRVPRPQDRVPRGAVLQPRLLRGAGGVRGRRRRRGAGGPHGVEDGARPADGALDAHARVLGLRLAPRLQPPAAGALLHPHPQRVRQDAGGQQGHPGQLEAQHFLPLHRPVQLRRDGPGGASNWSRHSLQNNYCYHYF